MWYWFEVIGQLESRAESYVLITVLAAKGSTPRDSGTKMVVTADQCYLTIGGGHLEFSAVARARELLVCDQPQQKFERFPLGAKLGQCCGGDVTLLFESFMPTRLNIMLFGAGHVGKALMPILAQLPCRLTWVDNRENEFPPHIPANVTRLYSDSPATEVACMPANSYYIVMTHNHPLDFEITEAILRRADARYLGLIGSETKWKRFQMRFAHRGCEPEFYQQVRCPVGLSAVPGKMPIEVAVSVAGEIIAEYHRDQRQHSTQQAISWRQLKDLTSDESPSKNTQQQSVNEKQHECK